MIRFLFFVALVFFTACSSTDECHVEKTVSLKMNIYKKTSSTDTSLSIDSLWVNGLSKDSFLYKNSKSISSINVPLNISKLQSDFVIQFNTEKDTLSVFYSNNDAYFISLPCGCIVTHSIDEVISTHHFIDSIRIVQRDVINVDAEHIKIFHN
ncbi:MAG: DUF6452 family protein [Paludibacter sp.]